MTQEGHGGRNPKQGWLKWSGAGQGAGKQVGPMCRSLTTKEPFLSLEKQ